MSQCAGLEIHKANPYWQGSFRWPEGFTSFWVSNPGRRAWAQGVTSEGTAMEWRRSRGGGERRSQLAWENRVVFLKEGRIQFRRQPLVSWILSPPSPHFLYTWFSGDYQRSPEISLLGTPFWTLGLLSRMFAFHVECEPNCLTTGFGLELLPCPTSELLHNLHIECEREHVCECAWLRDLWSRS